MKSLLIVYNTLSIGGSTTSLLSLLNELDYNKYQVDLLLRGPGIYDSLIPKNVNLLPYLVPDKKIRIHKLLSIKSLLSWFKALFWDKIKRRPNVRSQIMSLDTLRYCIKINKKYDVAISFIENLPMYYTLTHIEADKYITWIHLDYIGAKLNVNIDKRFVYKANKIVLVSNECKLNFDKCFPDLSNRSVTIENLLSKNIVIKRSLEKMNYELPYVQTKKIKFVTVCRIYFFHKGLDRGLKAIIKLKENGLLRNDFVWYIIGGGGDYYKMKNEIERNNLENTIILCGEFSNPLPISKQCDVFFLPSRYEGKPMAVTEAQMLGLLPVVTNYASAKEQIKNNENGVIIPNTDDDVYYFLKEVMNDDTFIWNLKKNVSLTDYSNIHEYKRIESLIN